MAAPSRRDFSKSFENFTTNMDSKLKPVSSPPPPPSPPMTVAESSLESSESEELQRLIHAPPFWKSKKKLFKQLSMCERATMKTRDIAWEKRRRQILRQERRKNVQDLDLEDHDLTDEDWHELKGSIELGFGFSDKAGQHLCNTLPALDLYLAVNRQLSPSPVSTPRSQASNSPRSEDSWKICSPGDDPQQVKTKLRHWAQAVACSVMQSI